MVPFSRLYLAGIELAERPSPPPEKGLVADRLWALAVEDLCRRGETTMATRRDFLTAVPAVGTAFAIAGDLVLEGGAARAQEAAPLAGHFHPKGKAPSQHTIAILEAAKAALPFGDTSDFDEQKRGLIAEMTEMVIPADAGHAAWDMARFQFLDQEEEFELDPPLAAPPVAAEQQLRPLRGDPRHLPGPRLRSLRHHLRPRQDRLDRLRPAGEPRAGACRLGAVPEACRRRAAGLGGDLFSHPRRPLGRGAGDRRRGRRALGQGRADRAGRLHGLHHLGERLRRQRDEPAAVLPVRPAAAGCPARLRRPGPRPGRVRRRRSG